MLKKFESYELAAKFTSTIFRWVIQNVSDSSLCFFVWETSILIHFCFLKGTILLAQRKEE